MNSSILGIHHITVMASDAQRNVDFYTQVLGLRFVKKSINQDAPDVYHLYYGDAVGSPGTALTFFPFRHAARGTHGNGEIGSIAFAVPATSLDFWIAHLSQRGIPFDGPSIRWGDQFMTFQDPDGLLIELFFTDRMKVRSPWKNSPVPEEYAVAGFYGVTLFLDSLDDSEHVLVNILGFTKGAATGNRRRYFTGTDGDEAKIDIVINPSAPASRQSAGSVHHIAWRVKDFDVHREWQQHIAQSGISTTEVIDRFYFHSIYFREPGGILYEIASDTPGFLVDEPFDELGSHLMLPPWFEPMREKIERSLPPIVVPFKVTS
jgi:glyoxalase family protein